MHKKLCQDKRFERLQHHRIEIPNLLELFQYFILPTRDDMTYAHDLYDYFSRFTDKSNPDLLENITEENSFGVHFVANSSKITKCLRNLQTQVEQDRNAKIQEVRTAKDKYNRLMNSISCLSCTCSSASNETLCRRCRIEEQAEDIIVEIYECPIPSEQASAFAVLFELRMPVEIRYYRDVLWQFINRSRYKPDNRMYEWLRVRPHCERLEPLFTGPKDYKVKLVSSNNSLTQTHTADLCIATAPIEDFLYENSLQIQLTPSRSPKFEDECRMLTPQLEQSDYKHLQYAIQSTESVQNQILADLSQIQTKFKSQQFIEYGSFRSGHRLQWWNLLSILEMDSLPLNEESVATLIIHTILQYGPFSDSVSWCAESHQVLFDDNFVDELILRLNRHLDDCALNWQNEFVLITVTMITMRVLTLCNSSREQKVVDLVLKCRRLGEQWIKLISSAIQTISSTDLTEVEKLRGNIVTIGVACLLTYSVHSNRLHRILSTNDHMLSLLKAMTNVHDNLVSNKKQTSMSEIMKYLLRFTDRILVQIQPTVALFLQQSSYQSLDDFAIIYWSVIRHEEAIDAKWKKRHSNEYDGWYDGQYESTILSIDCLRGRFLVNGMTVGYLPEKIISNELYLRVFDRYIFQVQISDSSNTYIAKYSYHDDGQVLYEFYHDDQYNQLIIYERHLKTNEVFELIPSDCLTIDLPVRFISEYSHWKNTKTNIIEFRAVHFKDPNFLTYKP
ncbi:unnamed protein product, partial [Adineta ricciae]